MYRVKNTTSTCRPGGPSFDLLNSFLSSKNAKFSFPAFRICFYGSVNRRRACGSAEGARGGGGEKGRNSTRERKVRCARVRATVTRPSSYYAIARSKERLRGLNVRLGLQMVHLRYHENVKRSATSIIDMMSAGLVSSAGMGPLIGRNEPATLRRRAAPT
jgi:hypothetical protein